MKLVKRIFISLLMLFTLNLYLPNMTFAEQTHLLAKADITKHPPEILTTPEEDIPVKVIKKRRWPWVVLGLLVLGGAAAAFVGGGDGDDDGGGGGDTGDVTVSW